MGSQQYHRRLARGAGYMCWSIPGLAGTLRVPWSNILETGNLSTVLDRLRRFEADVADLEENATWPPLPMPNAQIIYMDNAAFEEGLADRLIVYKERITRATGGAND